MRKYGTCYLLSDEGKHIFLETLLFILRNDSDEMMNGYLFWIGKGGFKSEDTGKILRLQRKYFKSLSWAENLNPLFTVLGGKIQIFYSG